MLLVSGAKVAAVLARKHWSQGNLALKSEVDKNTVSSIVRAGARGSWRTAGTAERIRIALGLNNLEQVPVIKNYTTDAASLHAMINAWQLTPSTRNRIADPSLWPVDVSPFVSKDTAIARWKCFDNARALTPAVFRGDTLSCGVKPTTAPAGSDAPDDPHLDAADGCTAQNHAADSPCRAH